MAEEQLQLPRLDPVEQSYKTNAELSFVYQRMEAASHTPFHRAGGKY